MALTKLNNQSLSAVTSAGLPAGTVLQVVESKYTSDSSTTSNSYSDANKEATRTPSSTSSKILVMMSGSARTPSGNVENAMSLQVLRGTTVITSMNNLAYNQLNGYAQESISLRYLDTPATTSAVTYKIQIKSNVNGQTSQLSHDGCLTQITLMEIAG